MVINSICHAQQDSAIYLCYINKDLNQWGKAIKQYQSEYDKVPNDSLLLYIIKSRYGLAAHLLEEKQQDSSQFQIEKSYKAIDTLIQKNTFTSDLYAYKGALMGFEIATSPLLNAYMLPKSLSLINKSIQADSTNANGWIQKGNALYYMPSVAGGNKGKAIVYFTKALLILEYTNTHKNNWIYLNTLAILAQAYEKTGNTTMAKLTYEKALQAEPNFMWVRDHLYPKLLKQLDKK